MCSCDFFIKIDNVIQQPLYLTNIFSEDETLHHPPTQQESTEVLHPHCLCRPDRLNFPQISAQTPEVFDAPNCPGRGSGCRFPGTGPMWTLVP